MSESQPVSLVLESREVQDIINVLGELPTKTGAYMLMIKIQKQATEYLKDKEES